MEHDGGSGLRTRSKAAPDWTVLILVNEVTAIEADCRGTLSSFQKWKIIVENCNSLGVNRNLNQCRRKWDSLLSDYKKIKQSGSKKASFNSELLKGIERYVRENEGGYDSEANSHPDQSPPPFPAIGQSGLKNQRSQIITPQKHTIQESKRARSIKSENIEVEECGLEQQVDHRTNTVDENRRFVEVSREEREQNMAEKLRENAQLIEAIVNDNNNNGTYDLTRINGDKIIVCLINLAVTLDELCKLQTDSVV